MSLRLIPPGLVAELRVQAADLPWPGPARWFVGLIVAVWIGGAAWLVRALA